MMPEIGGLGDPTLAHHTAQRIQEGDAFAAMAQFIWVIGVLAVVQAGIWAWLVLWLGRKLDKLGEK